MSYDQIQTLVDVVTIAAEGVVVVTLEETTMPSMLPRLEDKAAASPAVRFVASPITLPWSAGIGTMKTTNSKAMRANQGVDHLLHMASIQIGTWTVVPQTTLPEMLKRCQ